MNLRSVERCRAPLRWNRVSWLYLLSSVAAAQSDLPTPAPASAPAKAEPQSLSVYLDSLSDASLNADRSQIYRIDGQRRIIKLGAGWTAALDEQFKSRLSNAGSGPGTAGPPGRALEFVHIGARSRSQIYELRDSTGVEGGAQLAYQLGAGWTVRGETLHKRDTETGIVRRSTLAAVRFGDEALWVEAQLRHAGLDDPRANTPLAGPSPRADFAGLKAQWHPSDAPGLTLAARSEVAIKSDTAPGEERLARGATELSAEYSFTEGALAPMHVYWREAVRLGLLSSDGLEERATYRRIIGADVPDGSPNGLIYTQLRQHSLLDERDALLVVGWRHSLAMPPGWSLATSLEQAQPIAGPSAVRSSTVGLSLGHSAHPHHTAQLETEAVRSSVKDSTYLGGKYSPRMSENTLGAVRLSVTDQRPHDATLVPVTDTKLAFGWAWREPESRKLIALWRYSLIGRFAHAPDGATPGGADRHARILFNHFGWQVEPAMHLSLRVSRRLDSDQSFEAGALRGTDLIVARGVREIDSRWSISAHAGTLRDSALATQNGYGAEIGLKLSSKVVLAAGYNPRGMNDSELAIDDQLRKGFTLRLRFSFESALSRWLDPVWPLDR